MRVTLDLPLPDRPVFRYGAADEILKLAAAQPNRTFTNRECRRLTGYGGPSVGNALELLVDLELLVEEHRGAHTEYRLNGDRIVGTAEGIATIPQEEFHAPLQAFRERVLDAAPDVEGILVFGSVARGDADRRSDIDLFVCVAEDPPRETRRVVGEITATLEQQRFDGQRYSFDTHVESVTDVREYPERVTDILLKGIPIHSTASFDEVREGAITVAAQGQGGEVP